MSGKKKYLLVDVDTDRIGRFTSLKAAKARQWAATACKTEEFDPIYDLNKDGELFEDLNQNRKLMFIRSILDHFPIYKLHTVVKEVYINLNNELDTREL